MQFYILKKDNKILNKSVKLNDILKLLHKNGVIIDRIEDLFNKYVMKQYKFEIEEV